MQTSIAFVTPQLTLEERYGKFSGAGNTLPALGLLSLAAVLQKDGCSVSVIDAASLGLSIKELTVRLMRTTPKYVGIYATTLSIFNASVLAEEIKKIDNRIKIIVGGPHITAVPEESMGVFSAFDIGVIGEGEETILQLIQTIEEGGDLTGVLGIIYRDADSLVKTSARPLMNDLDTLPFPSWGLLEDFPAKYSPPTFRMKKSPAVYIVTSRGCPFSCIFCDHSVFGNRCRGHSAEYILDLFEHLYTELGIREVLIEDDTFVTLKKRLFEVCEGMISRGIKMSWSCLGRADAVNPEMLKLMKRAGCWQISYGIETGDEEIMKFIGKNLDLVKVEQALTWTREAGMLSKGFFIIGHPKDSHETIQKTIKFALQLPLDDMSVSMMTPFPGSKLHGIASEYGEFEDNWGKMNELEVVFIPKGLTQHDLERYSKELFRKFYLRPRQIINYMGRIVQNPKSLPRYVEGLRAFLKETLTF